MSECVTDSQRPMPARRSAAAADSRRSTLGAIRQALAYSFGLDAQDFVVAYETDDLVAFGDLVRALRATESRRSTVSDTPILLGIRRPIDEILTLLGTG